jgi:hypothetical protein
MSDRKEYLKDWYLKNKDRILQQDKEDYLKNKDIFKLRHKKYREENKEKEKQRHKKYLEEHPEYQNEFMKKYRSEYPWIATLGAILQRCTNSNHKAYKWYKDKFGDITVEQLRELWFECKAYLMEQPEIDRIDNDGVYTKSNLQYIEKVDHIIKTAQERKLKKLGVKI